MNESEGKFDTMGEPGLPELREEVASLRTMFSASLLLLFVFSFCVNIFLFHQASMAHAQASVATQLVHDFDYGGAAQAIDFWTKLNEYARGHPDFLPIINKYSKFINISKNGSEPAKKK